MIISQLRQKQPRLILPAYLDDALGRRWKNDGFSSESAIIDCAVLPAGLYFLSIEAKGGARYRNVVVVAH